MNLSGAHGTPIDLNLLRTFVVAAELRSFARAATRLAVERSSVSRQIAALEHALEVQLFSRTTRFVALTSDGAALHATLAPQLAALVETLETRRTEEDRPTGVLRLTTSVDFGARFLPVILRGFLARHPQVSVDLTLTNRVIDLAQEGLDCALRPSDLARIDPSLVARRVLTVEGHLYASPTYLAAAGTPRTRAELADHDVIWFNAFSMKRVFPPLKRAPRVSADEMLFAIEAVKCGLGIGALPAMLVADDVAAGHLVRVLTKQVPFTGGLYLVRPQTKHLPARVRAFRDFLLDHVA